MFYIHTGVYTVSVSSRVRHLNTHFEEHTGMFAHFMTGMQTVPQAELTNSCSRIPREKNKGLFSSFVFFSVSFRKHSQIYENLFYKNQKETGRL